MLFFYEYTRKKAILIVLMNMLVVAFYLYLFERYAVKLLEFSNLSELMTTVVVAIELILFGYILWRLTKPSGFVVSVTKDRFKIEHPTSKGFCIDVSPNDISKITHATHHNSEGAIAFKRVWLKNGDSFEICRNYNYSLKNMYVALKKANPLIELPEKF